ncbi:transposase family protein, partial [Pontiellaceae bacterium B12219]|nr:transposase family protein [Pontiellaceae bacterium B12219]
MPERKIEFIGKGFNIHSVSGYDPIIIEAEYVGPVACPDCGSKQLRTKDRIQRMIRHESFGRRKSWIKLVVRKYQCLGCSRYFRARMPGILPYKRSAEYFRREVCLNHRDGISQAQIRRNCRIGTATVER